MFNINQFSCNFTIFIVIIFEALQKVLLTYFFSLQTYVIFTMPEMQLTHLPMPNVKRDAVLRVAWISRVWFLKVRVHWRNNRTDSHWMKCVYRKCGRNVEWFYVLSHQQIKHFHSCFTFLCVECVTFSFDEQLWS